MTFSAATPPRLPTPGRRAKIALAVVAALIVLLVLFGVFVNEYTDLLWFRSVDYSVVFRRRLVVELVLFFVFGAVMAAVVAANVVVAYKLRPPFRPVSSEQDQLQQLREGLHRFRIWLLAAIVLIIGLITGGRASAHWSTWMLWRNRTSFHHKDPQFHKDVSYFAFTYPMQRFVLNDLFAMVVVSLIAVLITCYLYGSLRLQTPGPKWTPAGRVHVSVLLGVFVLLKSAAYWLDRFGLAFSGRGSVTGPSYTDVNAVLPAKTILVFVAIICALLFFANIVTRNWLLPAIAFGLMVVSALLIGGAYPAFVQQFKVKPSQQDLEAPYIQRNISQTRLAYGIQNVAPTNYPGVSSTAATTLRSDATTAAQLRLVDPNVVSQTFEQLQQQRSFYTFPQTLDVDRYQLPGSSGSVSGATDVVIGVRDIDLGGLPAQQQNWINDHLVYTHGYGVVAAQADAQGSQGAPAFIEKDLPPTGPLDLTGPNTQPRIYFGESSPSYSIVGAPAGTRARELDLPSDTGSGQTNTTYQGKGGVPIGSTWRQLLYAWKFQDKNILLSSGVNSDSQLLYVRDPRQRVKKVAPWLTLDGDSYPVVVDGQVDWIVDGYTTTSGYPYSEEESLGSATQTTLTQQSASVASQSNRKVNYIRNSVKAVVNAYTGKVSLYEWDPTGQPDPVLQTWMKAFPGVVQPQSAIPSAVEAHFRYPEDLFNIQRTLIAHYHVQNARDFYGGSGFWNVPLDPNLSADDTVQQPAYYFTMSPNGDPAAADQVFSLTSPLVSLNRRNLTAFLSVNSQPGPDYGKFTLLQVPANQITAGPLQVHNEIESTATVSSALSLLRRGGSDVTIGNLIAAPIDGGFLYVEPVYVEATGGQSFPVLRKVIAYNNGQVGYSSTLAGALNQAFGVSTSTSSPPPSSSSQSPPSSSGKGSTTKVSPALRAAVSDAQQAERAASAALKAQDFTAYGEAQRRLAADLRTIARLTASK